MDGLEGLIELLAGVRADIESGKIRVNTKFECRHCFNSGFREVDDPQGRPYKGVVRCDYCEYWNFYRRNAA